VARGYSCACLYWCLRTCNKRVGDPDQIKSTALQQSLSDYKSKRSISPLSKFKLDFAHFLLRHRDRRTSVGRYHIEHHRSWISKFTRYNAERFPRRRRIHGSHNLQSPRCPPDIPTSPADQHRIHQHEPDEKSERSPRDIGRLYDGDVCFLEGRGFIVDTCDRRE
jgi:hypothetical protein